MGLFDSPTHLLIVLVVLVVLFGSAKLPKAAKSMGEAMRIFKKEAQKIHDEDNQQEVGKDQSWAPQQAQQVTPPQAPQQVTAPQPQAAPHEQMAALQQQMADLQRQMSAQPAQPAQPVSTPVPETPQQTNQTS